MNIVCRFVFAMVFASLLVGALPVGVSAQGSAQSAEEILVDRYSPIAYVKYQEEACGRPPYEGEPYIPVPVEMVIDNEDVVIRDGANNDEIVATGPSAQELATLGPTTYMDFPGDPRRPGCVYETDERARTEAEGLIPTTYAKVIFDEENGRLALQYWFFWYFNHWNNTHESDWEGIMLVWDDVESVDDAVNMPPSRIGYSQHGNGEVADWGDNKIRLEDETHPLVYPAAGSHATFFSDDTFLAWGERSSGFGCDVASGPSERVPLDVVLIPNEIDPEGEFAWVLYAGRWGERQPSAFNGPLGPRFNARWDEPFDVFETWRPFSIVVPESQTLGPSMTEAFCTLTAGGSRLFMAAIIRPWTIVPAVVVIAGVFAYFTREALPTFRRARKLYTENWKLFLGIGLLSLPIGILFNGLQRYFVVRNPLKFVVQYLDNTGGAYLTTVLTVGGVQQLAMLLIITPALVYATREVLAGNKVTIKEAYLGNRKRTWSILLGFIIFLAVIGVLLLTTIGIPIAIWLGVKWHFFSQVLILERSTSTIGAIRESSRVVTGKWWRTLFSLVVFDVIAILPGIVVGFGLLTIGRTAVGFANGISSILYAILIPISTIAVTLLYLERRDNLHPSVAENETESVTESDDATDAALAPGNA